MTASLRDTSPNPSDDSVSTALLTPCNSPTARQQSIPVNPDREAEAPLNVSLSLLIVPGWYSQGRLVGDTPAEKRMRLSQRFPPKTKIWCLSLTQPLSEAVASVGRVNILPSLCLHLSYRQSCSQALKSPEVSAWKESIAA